MRQCQVAVLQPGVDLAAEKGACRIAHERQLAAKRFEIQPARGHALRRNDEVRLAQQRVRDELRAAGDFLRRYDQRQAKDFATARD